MAYFRHCLLIVLVLIAPSALRAHVVEQFYVKVLPSSAGWQLEILFDVGYAKPEWRGDPDTPQPSRDWLLDRSDEEHAEFRAETELFLNDCLGFNGPEEPIEVIYQFPDFDSSPPDFPKPLTGGAYYRVVIQPVSPPPAESRVWIAQTDTPSFLFEIPGADGKTPGFITLSPGESMPLPSASEPAPAVRPAETHAFIEGFLHVIPLGLDHILFILGLFLLQRSFRPLLWQSLTFTLAHTITLGLTAAGFIHPPAHWIEPIIALSILALAVENLFVKEATHWRFLLVFVFGLVHGMGFANALGSIVANGESFLPRLIAANLGVECAQVTILTTAWLMTLGWNEKPAYTRMRIAANVLLGLTALAWFIQRVS